MPSYTHSDETIEATFVANVEMVDFGVPGSPVWPEVIPETIEIQTLEILGVDVDPTKLPTDLYSAILDLADEGEFE